MIQTIIEAKLKLKYNKISFVFFQLMDCLKGFITLKIQMLEEMILTFLNRNAEPQF